MLYPTINELTKGKFNRYELALATAKCARLITDEYVKQREFAEKSMTGNKETDKPFLAMVNEDYRDVKAVKNALNEISTGKCVIIRKTPEQMAAEAEDAENA